MSISSEIARLQSAKADIKTAIEGKGVTVPSSTKLDGMATLIGNIQTGITPTGTINIISNGTYNVADKATARVTVPNTYAAADEGKVVSNGALVAQGSDTVTTNGTVDTTLINSLTVNVSGGGGTPTETLLKTIAVSSPVRDTIITIEDSWKSDYDYFYVKPVNVMLSVADWLYYVLRAQNGPVVGYTAKITDVPSTFALYRWKNLTGGFYVAPQSYGTSTPRLDAPYTTIHIYNYTSSATHTGAFEVYGGTL